jgi:hypothetical protein
MGMAMAIKKKLMIDFDKILIDCFRMDWEDSIVFVEDSIWKGLFVKHGWRLDTNLYLWIKREAKLLNEEA